LKKKFLTHRILPDGSAVYSQPDFLGKYFLHAVVFYYFIPAGFPHLCVAAVRAAGRDQRIAEGISAGFTCTYFHGDTSLTLLKEFQCAGFFTKKYAHMHSGHMAAGSKDLGSKPASSSKDSAIKSSSFLSASMLRSRWL